MGFRRLGDQGLRGEIIIRFNDIIIESLRNSIVVSVIKPFILSILFMRRVLISWGF